MRAALDRAESGVDPDLRDLFRRAHSLKGAARAVELPAIETEAHQLESLLATQSDAGSLEQQTIAVIRAALDRIENEDDGPKEEPASVGADPVRSEDVKLVRVRKAELDQLARDVGNLSTLLGWRSAHQHVLSDLARLLASEPPPYEVARAARTLAAMAREVANEEANLARALNEFEHNAQGVALAPVGDMLGGLDRMVRDLSTQAGKEARLRVDGGDLEADRRVLERLRDPLIHLIRNAVSHGIESPAVRLAAGKPASATVAVTISRSGGDLTIVVEDDGRGLDRAAIAKSAGLSGPLPPDPVLFAHLFEQGFSTAGTVDSISGRGVGLAVVAEAVRELGGRTQIAPAQDGSGTRAEIRVPPIAIRQMLLIVEAGGQQVGLPARAIRRLRRVTADQIETVSKETYAAGPNGAKPIRTVFLTDLIGGSAPGSAATSWHAAELSGGEAPLLLLVDELVSSEPQLVQAASELAVAAPLVAGLVVQGDAVIPVLDPAAVSLALRHRPSTAVPVAEPAAQTAPATILIVDDSVTTRTLERSILEGRGYRVLVAVDGQEALERLRANHAEIALVVADVEMPRLDGFGLLSAVRNDPMLANIPVVMMTSRDNPDDVRRGLDLGANAYVTKQTFEAGALLDTIARFV